MSWCSEFIFQRKMIFSAPLQNKGRLSRYRAFHYKDKTVLNGLWVSIVSRKWDTLQFIITWVCFATVLLACPHDNSSAVQARITKFRTDVQNTLVKIPIISGDDRPWPSRSNSTWNKILPHFELVCTITCHPLQLESPNFYQKCILVQLRSLLISGIINLQLQFHF